jgi:hypothetical protein
LFNIWYHINHFWSWESQHSSRTVPLCFYYYFQNEFKLFLSRVNAMVSVRKTRCVFYEVGPELINIPLDFTLYECETHESVLRVSGFFWTWLRNLSFIKRSMELLDQVNDCYLHKKGSTPLCSLCCWGHSFLSTCHMTSQYHALVTENQIYPRCPLLTEASYFFKPVAAIRLVCRYTSSTFSTIALLSALKMETTSWSESSQNIFRTKRRKL